jgi:hypothetical protein
MDLSRLTRRPASTALSLAALFAIAAASPRNASSHDRAPFIDGSRAIEAGWVRAHLDSVLNELPAHDVSALSTTQRERRSALLATLKRYRDAGEFPRNYDFPGEAVPSFTDRKTGTLCAVGYLLASTGRRDIVDRVTRADNNVRVRQLAGDTALAAWLNENGLTLAEAARIQVVYAQSAGPTGADVRRDAYLVLTPFALAGSLVSGTMNALGNSNGRRTGPNVTGLISGIASIGLGVALSNTPNIPRSSGIISAAVGGLSVALAVRALVHRHEIANAVREEQKSVRVHDVSITPLITVGKEAATGLAVSLRF